jgi:hypothetical protein
LRNGLNQAFSKAFIGLLPVLTDRVVKLIITDLNNHYVNLIKMDKPQNLIPRLVFDHNLIVNLTIDIKQELILKGVVIYEGMQIPLHIYPLRLVFLDLDPNQKKRILKYLSSYQQLLEIKPKL